MAASQSLQKHIKLLEIISQTRSVKLRESLLKNALKQPDFADAIMEICLNVVKGNISLPKEAQTRVKRYKSVIAELATRPKAKLKRKKLIIQSGNALPAIVPFLPVIATIISEVVKNVS